jgi:hypothetical protein
LGSIFLKIDLIFLIDINNNLAMDDIRKKYSLGAETVKSVQKELCSHLYGKGGHSLWNPVNSQIGQDIIMFDMIVTLQHQVDILTKKIEDYEKQTLPVAEAVEVDDDEPVKYEPLFPILDPTT